MHPFQWCNGCFCGLGLVSTNKSCSMPPISFQDLPLNIYMVIFGTGIFVFMLSLIFCCYFIRVSLCSPGCPGTHSADEAGLELRNPPASVSQVLGLKGLKCATTALLKAEFQWGVLLVLMVLSHGSALYIDDKLRNQAQSERYGYKEVVLKGDAKKLQLYGQTCAVCLEDFKGKDELGVLPCQHAFHRKCLVKWLEVRCVCPMCNKPIAGPTETSQSIGILLDELV